MPSTVTEEPQGGGKARRKFPLLSFLWSLLTYLVLFAGIGVALLVAVIPRVQNGASLTVLTQSMEPTIKPGDMVAVVPKPCSELNPGDIISFHPKADDPTLITHRIFLKSVGSKGTCSFTTKGDNNSAPDKDKVVYSTNAQESMVAGKVIYTIPKFGYLAQGVGGGRAYLTYIVAGVFILLALYYLFKPSKKKEPQVVERIVYRDRPEGEASPTPPTDNTPHQ